MHNCFDYNEYFGIIFVDLRRGRVGVGPMCRRRLTAGAYRTTVPYLITDKPGDTMDQDDRNDNRRQQSRLYLPSNRLGTFRNFFRMDRHIFDILYRFVAPFISKQDTSFGLSIPAEERLMLTLRFLATGASYRDLFYTWKISTAAISYIIMETCEAISTALIPTYVTVPQNSTQWLKIGEKYHNRWNFPNAGSLPLFRQKSVLHPNQ